MRSQEKELEQCYMRMEKGEPPNEEIERDWQRHLHDEGRKTTDKEMTQAVSLSVFTPF
jgi:hypothetical protein